MLLVVSLTHDVIVLIYEEDSGLVRLGLLRSHLGIGHDDDLIACLDTTGSGTVQTDDAGTSLAGDGIGLEAIAVVDIGNLHFLILQDA